MQKSMNNGNTIIFDIETVGERFDDMDERTQEMQTKHLKTTAENQEEYDRGLKLLKEGMGFSPLTGFIVAIAMLDVESNYLGLYYLDKENNGKEIHETIHDMPTVLRAYDEKTMLEKFWDKVSNAGRVVSFNGRKFDGPFLNARSMKHEVPVTADLVGYRYSWPAFHIDLFDHLTYFGTSGFKGNLHMWCRAMGIGSPKADGISGEDVAGMYQDGKVLDIARYSAGDIIATRDLYFRWLKFIKGVDL